MKIEISSFIGDEKPGPFAVLDNTEHTPNDKLLLSLGRVIANVLQGNVNECVKVVMAVDGKPTEFQ